MAISIPLDKARFIRRRRRAWRVSLWLSLTGHSVAALSLVWAVLSVPGLRPGSVVKPVAETEAERAGEDKASPPLEMMEVAEPPAAEGAPGGLDPEEYKARIRMGARETAGQNPEELMNQLNSLLGKLSGTSDESLDQIGVFLGKQPGSYKPRTYYKDELNRNADFSESSIVRASAYEAEGDMGYTVALRDKEKDEYVFTLEGDSAAPFRERNLTFDGKALGQSNEGEPFELKDAAVANIERWKREGDRTGMKGAIVTLRDPAGRELVLHLKGERYTPFMLEQRRFMMARMGMPHEDGVTLHGQGFDFDRATLLPPGEEDVWEEDGVLHARRILIDPIGERFITIAKGDEAKQYVEQTKALRNPLVRKIYESAGMHMLPETLNEEKNAATRREQIDRKRNQQTKDP